MIILKAYEEAESDIMSLPPRNPKKERLVTSNLLFRAYFLVGAICTVAGFNGLTLYSVLSLSNKIILI